MLLQLHFKINILKCILIRTHKYKYWEKLSMVKTICAESGDIARQSKRLSLQVKNTYAKC